MKALPYQFDLAAIFRFRDQYQVTHLQRNQNQIITYQILNLKIFKINYLSRLFINKKGVLSNLGHFFSLNHNKHFLLLASLNLIGKHNHHGLAKMKPFFY